MVEEEEEHSFFLVIMKKTTTTATTTTAENLIINYKDLYRIVKAIVLFILLLGLTIPQLIIFAIWQEDYFMGSLFSVLLVNCWEVCNTVLNHELIFQNRLQMKSTRDVYRSEPLRIYIFLDLTVSLLLLLGVFLTQVTSSIVRPWVLGCYTLAGLLFLINVLDVRWKIAEQFDSREIWDTEYSVPIILTQVFILIFLIFYVV